MWSPTGKPALLFIRRLCGGLAGKPVESPSALSSGPKGLQVERPVAPLSFADSLRERRDLVARHPDRQRIHPRPKPWLSAVGVNGVD